MSDAWKSWEGRVVDHKYQLQQFLASTDHSLVFLAEFHDPEPRQAAVKFVSADVPNKEQQLDSWKTAAQLVHPNLLRIYGMGQCKMDDADLLYVAIEYAEENLAQVLPHRPLMAEEAKEMLKATADVLAYLHAKNLIHGHIKPSNILASGEVLKLSTDTAVPANEVREMRRERSSYDAPELPASPFTSAADVWSLGVTLVEAFTQRPDVLPLDELADSIVPATIPEPFQEIARHALRREPALRWSVEQIAARLNPPAVAARSVAAAAASTAHSALASASIAATATLPPPQPPISPLDVPLSKEPAIPLAKQPSIPARPRPRGKPEISAPPETVVLPSYAIPLFAVLLLVIVLALLPFAFRRSKPQSASAPPSSAASSSSLAVSQPAPASHVAENAAPSPSNHSPSATPRPETPAPSPRTSLTDTHSTTAAPPPASTPGKSIASAAGGEPLDEVMPKPSAQALSTIKGTVRVDVKVHVDKAGAVTDAALDNPGPSHYFADLSLKAARQWSFTTPEANGRSVPSDWIIQFAFASDGPKATAHLLQP